MAKQKSQSTRQAKTSKPKKQKAAAKSNTNCSYKPTPATDFPPQLLDGKAYSGNKPSEVQVLYPGAVFVSRDFFTASECNAWIQFSESSMGFESVSHPATRYIAHRECGRTQKTDWAMAHCLFQRMKERVLNKILPQISISSSDKTYGPVGCNGNLRIYRYEKGMSFGKHVDGSNVVPEYPNGNTEITVLVYLSSCVGGATRFYPPKSSKKSVAFQPDAGAILLHVHGDRCLEHEADPVEHGVKYVLRTDIVYGTTGVK